MNFYTILVLLVLNLFCGIVNFTQLTPATYTKEVDWVPFWLCVLNLVAAVLLFVVLVWYL